MRSLLVSALVCVSLCLSSGQAPCQLNKTVCSTIPASATACKDLANLYLNYSSAAPAVTFAEGSAPVQAYDKLIASSRQAANTLRGGLVAPTPTISLATRTANAQLTLQADFWDSLADKLARSRGDFMSRAIAPPDLMSLIAAGPAIADSSVPEVAVAMAAYARLAAAQRQCAANARPQCTGLSAAYDDAVSTASAAAAALTAASTAKTTSAPLKSVYSAEAERWLEAESDLHDSRDDFFANKYDVSSVGFPPSGLKTDLKTSAYFRALLGETYSAASSTDPQAKLLADVTFDFPIKGQAYKAGSLWMWGYARIGSIGVTSNQSNSSGAITSTSQLSSSYASVLNSPPSQMVQSFETRGGLELQVLNHPAKLAYFDRVSVSFQLSVGGLTPASPGQTQAAQTLYKLDDASYQFFTTNKFSGYQNAINTACSIMTNGTFDNPGGTATTTTGRSTPTPATCYVELFPIDRGRFFRNYEGGLRIKLYPPHKSKTADLFPAILEAYVGQDEYVTAGGLKGPVVHLGGAAPLISGLYIFGCMDSAATKGGSSGPLLLQATQAQASAAFAMSTPPIANVQVAPPDRDRYSVGFGIDLVYLIRNHLLQDALSK